ncbi:MAG: group 1 glycosyl transferase, partial [Marivirga sp.]|nr:group 1 glycosyl transferase [Marivirga sp.]
ALEIPAVVSPVAVNKYIVTPGVHGFWCENKSEWIDRLSQLIENPPLRREMGKNGRIKVEKEYSVLSNKKNFLSLFQ